MICLHCTHIVELLQSVIDNRTVFINSYTADTSNFLIDLTDNLDHYDYFVDSSSIRVIFTRAIVLTDDSNSKDINLDQCVYVFWAYSEQSVLPPYQLPDNRFTEGLFQEQLCNLVVTPGE